MREIRVQENVVTVRDAAGSVAYFDTLQNFAADFGFAAPELAAGMASLSHRPDDRVTVYYDAKQNAFPVEGTHDLPRCDDVYALAASAAAAKASREAAIAAQLKAAFKDRLKEAQKAALQEVTSASELVVATLPKNG
jgi:hypothetical protein